MKPQDITDLYAMRHSLAHILATAVQAIWPDAKFGVGPVVQDGFYYDIDLGPTKLSEDNFDSIEAKMRQIIEADYSFERSEMNIDAAIDWAVQHHQPYKEQLLNDLKRAGTTAVTDIDPDELGTVAEHGGKIDKVSFYTDGDFIDLCRGPHVESTGRVGAFKLMRVAGAYWRGKAGNPQMQRLYGVAFATPEELKRYLDMLEEAKKRDHRKIGQELDLFLFSDMVGSGLPMFTPRGTVLRTELAAFAESLRLASGYERVSIPHITKTDLYKVSGHWDKFGSQLFLVESQETSDKFALKPMNCPHHNQIYASRPRSYRDLPIRYFETTTVYRDEKTGELGGLNRVRSITQDDSHAYVRPDQVEQIVASLIGDVRTLYTTLGLSDIRARLSFRDDSDKYLGDVQLWEDAQASIRELALSNQLTCYEARGEAAFYGPKIDFMATDAIGREHQVATVQLDFVQPERFQLQYTAEDGSARRPVMAHCAILGSIERFLSVYIEHTAGRFPVWLAPEQIRLIAVNQQDTTAAFAGEVLSQAKALGLRATVDDSNESVGKKIRAAELMKVPYTVVLGEKEIDSGEVTPRIRKDLAVSDQAKPYAIKTFLQTVADEVKSRAGKTSL